MEIINIHAAKTNLSKLIERALAGEEVVISRNGEPVVNLVPHHEIAMKKPRAGGQWAQKIWYAPDYAQADALIETMFAAGDASPKKPS